MFFLPEIQVVIHILMFPSSQVLEQLNVFSSDDVDSAAEALNDVSLT